ncbi:YoaK family protein [Actinoallomurus sp. NPDC052274]|uniref:YoaK family protein n=1 Tax=Actinoallomurus sp. NPDC052274 TaxID=3155420 RepID=UPI00343FFD5A
MSPGRRTPRPARFRRFARPVRPRWSARPAVAPREGAVTAAVFLLALGSGAADAFSFVALGAVFTSVMTGNLVLLGVAVVHTDAGGAVRSVVSITAYATGVLGAASWLRDTSPADPGPWPDRVVAALTVVPVAQAAVLAGWLAAAARPGTAPQVALIAGAAAAMGVQSTAVNTLAVSGAATTYLTGTLTSLMTETATTGSPLTMRRRAAVLTAALGGAALEAVLLTWVRPVAPALPLLAALTVVAAMTVGRAVPRPRRS